MEERDIQIRGHKVRLDLDVLIVATANPEDYTNRGRIITPLKDRYGAQIRTHYPESIEAEMQIMAAERTHLSAGDYDVIVPEYMAEIVAEISRLARRSPDVNQRSGVSVRASVANYESMLANALRRAIRLGETDVVPRISDLPFVLPSLQGKVELDTVEEGRDQQVLERLLQGAIVAVFNRHCDPSDMESIVQAFKTGLSVDTGESMAANDYESLLRGVEGLSDAVAQVTSDTTTAVQASAIEFVLEGLHLNKRLNKDALAGQAARYRG
jgi:magnesium chelatase subunit I